MSSYYLAQHETESAEYAMLNLAPSVARSSCNTMLRASTHLGNDANQVKSILSADYIAPYNALISSLTTAGNDCLEAISYGDTRPSTAGSPGWNAYYAFAEAKDWFAKLDPAVEESTSTTSPVATAQG